jgi:glycosyltransferase involved in cell wall biosynthesis
MRIGVNALYLIPGGVGGTEIYLRNLLQALARIDTANEYVVFTNRETGPDLVPDRFKHAPLPVRAVNRPARLVYEQTGLAMQTRRHGIDVLFNPGFTAPAFPGCPNVTVFHDLQHKRHPEHFRALDLPAWNFFLWVSVKRSRLLLAVSEATRDDLRRFYGVEDERIVVSPLGVEPEFYAIRRDAPEPFFLCVSTLHPHKNLENLLRAFARFYREKPEYSLVMTGVRGFHTQEIERLIRELKLTDSVRLSGWIERNELYDLFRRATAMFYPSTFEGFGLPVVEAMAAGLPLACSNIEPLHSIVAGAAVEFPPEDMDAMLSAMHRMTGDTREFVERGRRRAESFTWEETARKTLVAIEASLRAGSLRRSSRRDISR